MGAGCSRSYVPPMFHEIIIAPKCVKVKYDSVNVTGYVRVCDGYSMNLECTLMMQKTNDWIYIKTYIEEIAKQNRSLYRTTSLNNLFSVTVFSTQTLNPDKYYHQYDDKSNQYNRKHLEIYALEMEKNNVAIANSEYNKRSPVTRIKKADEPIYDAPWLYY